MRTANRGDGMSAEAIALCAACIDENDRIAHGTPLTPAAQRAMERQRERLQSLYLLLCEETAEPVQLDAAAWRSPGTSSTPPHGK